MILEGLKTNKAPKGPHLCSTSGSAGSDTRKIEELLPSATAEQPEVCSLTEAKNTSQSVIEEIERGSVELCRGSTEQQLLMGEIPKESPDDSGVEYQAHVNYKAIDQFQNALRREVLIQNIARLQGLDHDHLTALAK